MNREKNNNIYYSLKLKLLHLLRNTERIPHESISLASCTRRREIEGYRKGRGGHRWEISQAKEAGRSTAVTIKRTRETEKYGIVWEGNAAIKLLLSLSLSLSPGSDIENFHALLRRVAVPSIRGGSQRNAIKEEEG